MCIGCAFCNCDLVEAGNGVASTTADTATATAPITGPLTSVALAEAIDGVLAANNFSLSQWLTAGSEGPLTLTYQFETSKPADYPWTYVEELQAYTEAEKDQIRTALDFFETVLNVDFVESRAADDADISFYQSADPEVASHGQFSFWNGAWDGSVLLNGNMDFSDPASLTLILQEIGHALGLTNAGNGADAESALALDVAALQAWWGANAATGAGDTNYDMSSATEGYTIWDASGSDALSYGGSADATIDLRPGAVSFAGDTAEVLIGYGAEIEHASGGSGNDTLIGTDADNTLRGNGGDDDILAGAGNDMIAASSGNDTVSGGSGNDQIGGGAGNDALSGDAGHDVIGGGAGNDVILGGTGDDFIGGGAGNDVINGQAGNDTINGGAGDDVMRGGAGADVFAFNSFTNGETDMIYGFEDGIDKIQLSVSGLGQQGNAALTDGLQFSDFTIDSVQVNGINFASLTWDGHTIQIGGMNADLLGANDFIFV